MTLKAGEDVVKQCLPIVTGGSINFWTGNNLIRCIRSSQNVHSFGPSNSTFNTVSEGNYLKYRQRHTRIHINICSVLRIENIPNV